MFRAQVLLLISHNHDNNTHRHLDFFGIIAGSCNSIIVPHDGFILQELENRFIDDRTKLYIHS